MKKIAIRIPVWLGDAVVSTVFLRELKKLKDPCELTVLCPESLAGLFLIDSNVSEVIPLAYSKGGSVFDVAEQIRAEKFDELYVLPRSIRTALEAALSGIPHKVGFGDGLRSFIFDRSVANDNKLLYAQRYLKLIDRQHLPSVQLLPFFPVQSLSSNHALASLLDNPAKPILGIAPFSIAPARTWPTERFIQIAQKFIRETHGSVICFGSPAERNRVDEMAKNISGNFINSAGQLSLLELGYVLSQCQSFLGNDSGLMHVTMALSIPSVIIFGPSESQYAVLPTSPIVVLQNKKLFCSPCLKNDCVRFGPGKYECLTTITEDLVYTEIIKQLRKSI